MTSEPNLAEEVITKETEAIIDVMANSDAISGLDKGVFGGGETADEGGHSEVEREAEEALAGQENERGEPSCHGDLGGVTPGGHQSVSDQLQPAPVSGREGECDPSQQEWAPPLAGVPGIPFAEASFHARPP